MFDYRTEVAYTQAANCFFCLHVGSTALYFGTGNGKYGHRLEVCTPYHWFRFSWGGNRVEDDFGWMT